MIVSVVLPEVRATAIALSIFTFHLLGDVPSPILIGRVSDWTGDLGQALLLTSAAIAVSGIFYLWGARSVGEDTRRVLDTVRRRERDAQGDPDAA